MSCVRKFGSVYFQSFYAKIDCSWNDNTRICSVGTIHIEINLSLDNLNIKHQETFIARHVVKTYS